MNHIGLCLSTYTETLHKVADAHQEKSWDSFDPMDAIGDAAREYIRDRFVYEGSDMPAFEKIAARLPREVFSHLTFDQLCKIRHSSIFTLDRSVDDLFERDSFQHVLVHKIISSMWRWGTNRSKWNNIVDAHRSILSFDLGLEDFDVRLDYTTYYNPCGASEHSDTYLDGVFAYLVHYRGEHVMTLGFSIMEDRRVLIQQVQLVKRHGNRFLYRMPKNRLEYIISRFKVAFSDHDLFIVDGDEIATKSLNSYKAGYKRAVEKVASLEQENQLSKYQLCDLTRNLGLIDLFAEKVQHMIFEVDRLRMFYANSGRFHQGEPTQVNNLTHYLLSEINHAAQIF